jgi:hypothetical protein
MDSDPTGIPPISLSVADATKVSGLSRSELYRQLARGTIRAVKLRSRTYILDGQPARVHRQPACLPRQLIPRLV